MEQRKSQRSNLFHLPFFSDAEFDLIKVPMTNLDVIVETSGQSPFFVKIDVEGFELEVLAGMRRIMEPNPPRVIQFEFNTHHLRRRQNMNDFVAALPGFHLYRLAARSLRPLDHTHHFANIYVYSNAGMES
jgi:hypothetical protein